MCSFLGMQSFRIGSILVLEGSFIPLHLVKVPFGDSCYIFWHFISTFLFENTKLRIEKKKKNSTLIFWYFESVGKGQTDIFFFFFFFFFFRPYHVANIWIELEQSQWPQSVPACTRIWSSWISNLNLHDFCFHFQRKYPEEAWERYWHQDHDSWQRISEGG